MTSKSIPNQGASQYIHRYCRWWGVNISADAPQTALFFSRLKRDLMGQVMKCPKHHARTFRFCFLGFASNPRSGRVITKGPSSQALQAVQGQLQQPSDMHAKLNILLLAAVIVSFYSERDQQSKCWFLEQSKMGQREKAYIRLVGPMKAAVQQQGS